MTLAQNAQLVGETTEDTASINGEHIWIFILPLFRCPGFWIRATIALSDHSSLCFFWHHLLYLTSYYSPSSPIAIPLSSSLLTVFSTKIAPKLRKQLRSMTQSS